MAESDDVPGLATEAETYEAMLTKLRDIIPALLEANGLLPEGGERRTVPVRYVSERNEMISGAA